MSVDSRMVVVDRAVRDIFIMCLPPFGSGRVIRKESLLHSSRREMKDVFRDRQEFHLFLGKIRSPLHSQDIDTADIQACNPVGVSIYILKPFSICIDFVSARFDRMRVYGGFDEASLSYNYPFMFRWCVSQRSWH